MGRSRGELAALIRQFVIENFDSLAKRIGHLFVIRAGDVADAMRLRDRMPSICGALESPAFLEQAGLTLDHRTLPKAGRTAQFFYKRSGVKRVVPPGANSTPEGTGDQDLRDLEARIYRQVIENLDEIDPVRRFIRARDVADSIGLKGRMAEVCSALSSRRFQDEARLHLEDAIFQYVPDPAPGAPDLLDKRETVDEGVGHAVPMEAVRGRGDRHTEPRVGAVETSADLSSDRDPIGLLHRLWRVVRAWFGRFGRGASY